MAYKETEALSMNSERVFAYPELKHSLSEGVQS